MVSRYMRSRVTAGECSYCSRTWSNRDVSPFATAKQLQDAEAYRLQVLRGFAPGPRQHVVAVQFRLLLIALPVLVRLDRIALRVLHRLGNVHVREVDGKDANAHVVPIQRAL